MSEDTTFAPSETEEAPPFTQRPGILTFTNKPSALKGTPKLQIERQRGSTPLKFICLSHEALVAEVHFYRRSIPHIEPREHCQGCQALRRKQEEAHVIGWNPKTGQIAVYVITAGAALTLELYFTHHNTLRGAEIQLSRAAGKAKAPQLMAIRRSDVTPNNLPATPNLEAALTHIWGLSPDIIKKHVQLHTQAILQIGQEPLHVPFDAAAQAAADHARHTNAPQPGLQPANTKTDMRSIMNDLLNKRSAQTSLPPNNGHH